MLFCPRCKSMLIPKKDDPKKISCNHCGYTSRQRKMLNIKERTEKEKKIEIIDKTMETLPKTDAKCPECGHNKAYYWLAQTRAADEAETQFFRCAKCGHQWRQY
ncbi:MAG: transcription factor S [Nanoarchaeota archaeon]